MRDGYGAPRICVCGVAPLGRPQWTCALARQRCVQQVVKLLGRENCVGMLVLVTLLYVTALGLPRAVRLDASVRCRLKLCVGEHSALRAQPFSNKQTDVYLFAQW